MNVCGHAYYDNFEGKQAIAFSLLCDPTLTLFKLAYANDDPQESKS